MESVLQESGLDNWLEYIENPRLLEALCQLSPINLKILFLLYVCGCTQEEVSKIIGIKQAGISKRHNKLIKNLQIALKQE